MTRVTLLTQADCGLCEDAKEVLDRLAGELGLEVEAVDLATERGRALAERSRLAFPPGVLLEGRPFSHGRLSERRLRKELARRSPSPSA